MKTLTNTTRTKAVNIKANGMGSFIALYVQRYNNDEQVLDTKTYATEKSCVKWANNKLGI